ncbi:MAG: polyribonucleotide nucleotidyltransferase [Bdellovibrionales bacterium RIFOXYA1_FULL_36_14]|nr:MAG: polyribonucleotide nucleotidyltransferase [Bdellovibrionales bacterium RIFOXYA1_FULL_36_14]
MNENKREFKVNYGGKEVVIETGRLAKQADGAVLVTCGKTQVLVTACSDTVVKDGQDFFPLTVDYREKFFAAGKFLGGFMKRENRPSTQETLCARLLDRPLRPMFPEGYLFETFIQATVLSYESACDPEVLAGIGSSAALTISDIPFVAPIASCKVGRIDGQFVLNPGREDWAKSDLELVVSASKDAILMVEGEAHEVSEEVMLEALHFAHTNIKTMVELIEKMGKEVGKKKREFVSAAANETLIKKVKEEFTAEARAALSIIPKLPRQKAVGTMTKKVVEKIKNNPKDYGLSESNDAAKEAAKVVDELLYHMMRTDILKEEKRIGGRKLTQVRPIETEVNILKNTHGSALFTRGETQVMGTVTIGGSEGEQMSDNIAGIFYDKFYLHYNFPPFSVGEARGSKGGAGRRELGHGNLAERAIKNAMPKGEEFPYTIRVCCEVLESNGSSSMGSVCAASMALMDAGVPLSGPVAGVAMGLVTDKKDFKILTDILGDEDHLGDMDFKVAGTKDGINSIQMDIKITGITEEIIKKALSQAKEGRLHILNEMSKTISSHNEVMRDNVPKMESFKIDKDKIGALIGPGGKNIKAVQEKYNCKLECGEDGTIRVMGSDSEKIQNLIAEVSLQINGPELGSKYKATVVTIKEYGAFVDIASGVSGLVHISELSDERVQDVYDFVKEGDIIDVEVLEIDRMGRIKLSAKTVKPLKNKNPDKYKNEKKAPKADHE